MRLFLLAALTISFSTSAYAQGRRAPAAAGAYRHELMTNLTGGIFSSGKACNNCSSGSILSVGGSYLRHYKGLMQYGAEGRFINASEEVSGVGNSVTRFEVLAVGAYNFESNFDNSFFAKAGLGFYSVHNGKAGNDADYENKIGFFLGAGKRFNWLSNLAYAPEIRLVKKGDIDIGIDIHVLNFAINW